MNSKPYLWRNLFSEDDVIQASFLVRNGSRILHSHDYFEFILTISGSGDFRIEDRVTKLRAAKLFVLPPGVNHSYANCRNLKLALCSVRPEMPESLSLLMGLSPGWLRQIGLTREDQNRKPVELDLDQADLGRCSDALTSIVTNNRTHDEVRMFTRLGGFLLFISAVLHSAKRQSAATAPQNAHPLTLRALSILRSDPARNWRLAELCQLLQRVHPVYFCRIFKRDIEMTPTAYLRSIRCQQAARFLTTTDWPINQVGMRVGWDDPNLFSRRFRAQLGLTPSAYRKRYRTSL